MDGFIPGSRGDLILDLMATIMLAVLLVQTWSLVQIRVYQRTATHRRAQLVIAGILAATVVVFEADVRLNGWVDRAKASPYFDSWMDPVLVFHLGWALACVLLWSKVLVHALRTSAQPGSLEFRRAHRRFAIPAATALYGTVITGLLFFWLAFIAS